MEPQERIDRLLGNVRRGWAHVRSDEKLRRRVVAWLEEHPAGWPPVQEIWLEALAGRGELHAWLEADAKQDRWPGPLPLHSVLTSHPFACLPRWSTRPTSSAS